MQTIKQSVITVTNGPEVTNLEVFDERDYETHDLFVEEAKSRFRYHVKAKCWPNLSDATFNEAFDNGYIGRDSIEVTIKEPF